MNYLEKYDGFIFDLDGTIYLDDKLIGAADKVINKLVALEKKIVFVTNKTTGTSEDYFQFLHKNNLNVKKNQILTASLSIKTYLLNHHSDKTLYAIAEQKFNQELKSAGFKLSENPNEIDIVIVTLDRTLNYNKLEVAAKALDNGAKFYAVNIDNTCPVEGGEILDAGSTISALEKRTHRKLEKHFGKPSDYMFKTVINALNVSPKKCLIIGDRVETDIAMGNIFGVDTALVSTGVKNDLFSNGQYTPTFRIESIFDLVKKTQ